MSVNVTALLDTSIKDLEKAIGLIDSRELSHEKAIASLESRRNKLAQDKKKLAATLALLKGLDTVGMMPLEGADKPTILLSHSIQSESTNKFYHVNAELHGSNIVLTCDCERFRYSRGVIANGEKPNCKHIIKFRRVRPAWSAGACGVAEEHGVTKGRIYFDPNYSLSFNSRN